MLPAYFYFSNINCSNFRLIIVHILGNLRSSENVPEPVDFLSLTHPWNWIKTIPKNENSLKGILV